jgi:anti-sigma regulatory factor (Ser/Thr protein kinase)
VLSAEQGLRVGAPLGVGTDLPYEVLEVPLPAGTRVALYTDGLVESPGHDVDAGIDAVAAALADAAGGGDDLEAACDRAIAAGVPHAPGRPDDVALLLVQAEPQPADAVVSVELAPDPAAVHGARELFAETLARWGLADTGAAVAGELLVSEVVTNAMRYAGGWSELTVRRGDRLVHVEVRDGDTRLPRLRHAALDDEGGRGLELVQALSRSWGARPLPDGKVVWFSLEAPPAEPAPEQRPHPVRAGA